MTKQAQLDKRRQAAEMFLEGHNRYVVAQVCGIDAGTAQHWRRSWKLDPEAFLDEAQYGTVTVYPATVALARRFPHIVEFLDLDEGARAWAAYFRTDQGQGAFQDLVRICICRGWSPSERGPHVAPEPNEQLRRLRLLFRELYEEDV